MQEQSPRLVGLPAPNGPYPVGRLTCHWQVPSDDKLPPSHHGGRRELMVWIWYPAALQPGAQAAEYLPAGWEAVGQFWGFQAAGVRAHAYPAAPVALDRDRYPVLVFSPAGFPPFSLTAIIEEIASYGYVVVGINHTAESVITVFPDGRVVPMDAARMQPVFGPFSGAPEATLRARAAIADDKAADLHFVVDRLAAVDASLGPLAGHLDLARLGAFGHSLGGNAALEYCRLDARCKAAANLDGGLWNAVGRIGLSRPVLLILAEHAEMMLPCDELVRRGVYLSPEWCAAERGLTIGGWQTVYERGQPGYAVQIKGSGHISFLDVPFLPVEPGSMLAGGLATVRIDGQRAWRIICDYLLAFFGRHLDGAPAPLLGQPPAADIASGPPGTLFAVTTAEPS